MEKYFIGIDSGTSGIKAVLFDLKGNELGQKSFPLKSIISDVTPGRKCCFCDGRAAKIVDRWVEDGTCDKLFEITGTRIFTGNQNGIVKWMEEHEPENLDKSRWLLHLKDYLFYRFTGKVTTDATDQSLISLRYFPQKKMHFRYRKNWQKN